MKRNAIITLILLALLTFTSCITPPVVSSSANINNPYVGISELDYENYTILGRVTGTGEVSFSKTTNIFTGDTMKYGYLGLMGNAGQLSSTAGAFSLIPSQTTTVMTPNDCYGKSESNACYAMIQAAREKNADAIIFVMKSFENKNENGVTTSKCTMTGVAIKLK